MQQTRIVGAPSTVVELGTRMRVVVGSNPAQTELASTVVRSEYAFRPMSHVLVSYFKFVVCNLINSWK